MFTVADAMTTEPITVGPDEPLARAEGLMREARIRHLPVVQRGALVGLLTRRDITGARRWGASIVSDAMVTDVVTVHAGAPLRRAARLLWERKISCVPVIDARRNVLGILTEADFVRFAAEVVTDLDRAEATALRLHP